MWLDTKGFVYITSKSRGLCGGAMCVLFVWLVGVCMSCVCGVVGVVRLGVWMVLGGRVMWGLYVVCVMCVFCCSFC